jgi:hypothetical protein
MLKKRITKAIFDSFSKDVQAFYKADGEDYVLQVETSADDDPGELRRALTRVREDHKTEKDRADRLQTQVDGFVADPNKAKDLRTLETSWQQKLTDQKNADQKTIERLTVQLKKAKISDQASAIANEIAGDNGHLLIEKIEKRLTVNLDGETAETRVLDANGALSASTVEDLKKEFVANPKYSGIIIASKASGGATGTRTSETSAVLKDKKFDELTTQERTDWLKRDRDGFNAAAKANREEKLAATRKF